MKTLILGITLVLLCTCDPLIAQNISTSNLKWKVDSLLDLRSNERFVYNCNFETTGHGSIVWNQNGGFISSMTVDSATGSWTNVQTNGSITFSIQYEEEPGTIRFERVGSRCIIRLILGDPGQPTLQHEYIVSLITSNP